MYLQKSQYKNTCFAFYCNTEYVVRLLPGALFPDMLLLVVKEGSNTSFCGVQVERNQL